jgi:phosphate:Na+ symporter
MIRQIPIIAILLLTPGLILAADSSESGISWGFVIMNLLGGLALFLYGMEKMSDGMKKASGDRNAELLSALTRNRVIGLLVGRHL